MSFAILVTKFAIIMREKSKMDCLDCYSDNLICNHNERKKLNGLNGLFDLEKGPDSFQIEVFGEKSFMLKVIQIGKLLFLRCTFNCLTLTLFH